MREQNIVILGRATSGKSTVTRAILTGRFGAVEPANSYSINPTGSFQVIDTNDRLPAELPMYLTKSNGIVLVLDASKATSLAEQATVCLNQAVREPVLENMKKGAGKPKLLVLINKVDGDDKAAREKKVRQERQAVIEFIEAQKDIYAFDRVTDIQTVSVKEDAQAVQTAVNQWRNGTAAASAYDFSMPTKPETDKAPAAPQTAGAQSSDASKKLIAGALGYLLLAGGTTTGAYFAYHWALTVASVSAAKLPTIGQQLGYTPAMIGGAALSITTIVVLAAAVALICQAVKAQRENRNSVRSTETVRLLPRRAGEDSSLGSSRTQGVQGPSHTR